MKEILLVDKPAGWTSFDVVAKIRGMLRAKYTSEGHTPTKKQLKVGHAGTLDPFATGLLIVLLGDATKRSDEFLKLDKVYEATMTLGSVSSTGDPEGEIVPISDHKPSRQSVEVALAQFIGEIEQRPPMHSAIKIDGQRAYKLARKGQEVEMPLRKVTIHSIELLQYDYPEVKIRTNVSSGTYIRSLARDIGDYLDIGAYCSDLRRISIDKWNIEDAAPIENIDL